MEPITKFAIAADGEVTMYVNHEGTYEHEDLALNQRLSFDASTNQIVLTTTHEDYVQLVAYAQTPDPADDVANFVVTSTTYADLAGTVITKPTDHLADDGIAEDQDHDGSWDDSVSGTAGNDVRHGGAGGDHIRGNDGDDRLFGEEGNDHITGDAGNDTISGGARADVISGGLGNDRVSAIDAIPSTVGDNAFAFVGTAAFTAAGQIRVEQVGADTLVSLNLDTNLATAEMSFILQAVASSTVSAVDFVL
ncbi:hypothetical protein OLX02_14990 [Novosphingobium sp. KCTC 2891]|uniref:calcium-binding protein n=1 Tax=Novosphingobium sp. KCTC 2891 TaxID=2989730 RepID=UPI002221C3DC|nr:hypothetical protein [Novosphingobium sp. KCTC 2891]MCW1384127.1 hypothetical protein [Novosphingobium sp. KCTC 2891]